MLGDVFYSLGSWVGGLTAGTDVTAASDSRDAGPPARPRAAGASGSSEDNGFLVDAVLGSVAAWAVARVLRPRSVSWPRVVVAGIGGTILSELVRGAVERPPGALDAEYTEDPDAILVRLGSGVALAAGYASLLYPRVPGSPLVKGLAWGVLEIAAAPRGGLAGLAGRMPALRFPLKELAAPADEATAPLSRLAFGIGLGLLYRPADGDDDEE